MKKIVSFFWIVLNIIPCLYFCLSIKYPTFRTIDSLFDILLFIVLPYVVPVIFPLIFFFITRKKEKLTNKIVCAIVVLVALNIVVVLISLPFNAANFYTSTSKTNNYLIVDDGTNEIIDNCDIPVRTVFPDSIPESASDKKYYYCHSVGLINNSIAIIASWDLPENDFDNSAEQARLKHPGVMAGENLCFDYSTEDYYLVISYNDNAKSVKYTFLYDYYDEEYFVDGLVNDYIS